MDYKSIKVHNIGGLLSKTFLHNSLTPVIAVFILILGYIALTFMPREENPQMIVSGGNIIVSLPGATPQEVENVIVKPIERKMKEVLGVEHVQGIARQDVGIINVMFFIGEDKEQSNLKMYDKMMQNLDILPLGASQPLIKPLDIDTDIPIYSIAFYSKNNKISQADLYEKVKQLQQKFNAIENIAQANIIGGHKKQFNILLDTNKLNRYNLTINDVKQALSAIIINSPQLKKARGNEIRIGSIKNVLQSINDVQNIIIPASNTIVYLKDIATISDGVDFQNYKKVEINLKDKNLYPQVTLTLSKLKGSNAVVIADEVTERLSEMRSEFEKEGINYTIEWEKK
eukprot:TRINITY_DN3843_c0_g1_i5.p1 TRINITY_DN3843_c0_g1~~TRINITY_DN3843_c0_g1_i5.p1  ORF type:complete len:343 (+),score=-71.97 TRINITY_DN3843_c0_g1_i5:589-1617(+)